MKRIILFLTLVAHLSYSELDVGPCILIYNRGGDDNKIEIIETKIYEADGFKFIDFDRWAGVQVKITESKGSSFVASFIPDDELSGSKAYIFRGRMRSSDKGWSCTLIDYSVSPSNDPSRDILLLKEQGYRKFIMYPVGVDEGNSEAE